MPTPTTAPSDDSLPVSGDTIGEDDLSRVFGDLEAAVALARDAALAAVRAAVRLRREADAMKQLKALLKTLD
jgi:class 3 adenylate cyclase